MHEKGFRHSEETKLKMSQSQTGIVRKKGNYKGRLAPNKLLICKSCKEKFPRKLILLEDVKGYCDNCSSHTKLCDCGCGETIFKYQGKGTIRKFVHGSHAGFIVGTRKDKPNKQLTCKSCKITFSRELIRKNDGFCDNCMTHTKMCDCGCKETIFRYNKQGGIKQCKNQNHRNRLVWNIPGARKNGSMAQLKRFQDPEERERQSKSMKKTWKTVEYRKLMTGENHPHWKGGISHEPYDELFTPEFKELVRKRQNHYCADKDKTCSTGKKALSVHHIDGNKRNSTLENCVALCNSHHARTTLYNDESMQKYYKAFIDNSQQ